MNGNGSGSGVPNLDRLLRYLGESLSNGWTYFVTAKHLRNAYENGRVSCARFFFMTTYHACLDRAIQVVQELVSGEDSLLPGLLAIAERNPEAFSQVDPETVRGRANACHLMISGLYAQLAQLRGIRSQLPTPRENDISDAELLETFSPAQLMGLQKAYRDALAMLNEFSGYYHSTPPNLSFVEETIQDDIDFVMTILSGNCV